MGIYRACSKSVRFNYFGVKLHDTVVSVDGKKNQGMHLSCPQVTALTGQDAGKSVEAGEPLKANKTYKLSFGHAITNNEILHYILNPQLCSLGMFSHTGGYAIAEPELLGPQEICVNFTPFKQLSLENLHILTLYVVDSSGMR